jgi:hypothetical protein
MNKFLALATAGTLLIGAAAQATETAYTDKATFLTAVGVVNNETFQAASVGNFASAGGVFNATFDGFKIAGQNNGNYVGIASGPTASGGQNTPIPSPFTVPGNQYLTWANITGGIVSLTVNFNKATTAFGFDYFDTDVTDSYQINLPGGTVYNSPPFALASGGLASTGFFGLTSTTPFTSVIITNAQFGGYISDEGVDNVLTNGAGSVVGGVPEASTWVMLVGGFGLVGVASRRRRTAVAA